MPAKCANTPYVACANYREIGQEMKKNSRLIKCLKYSMFLFVCIFFPSMLFGEDPFRAVEKGDIKELQKLIDKKKLDPNIMQGELSLLIHAINNKQPSVANLLLEAGANPNFKSKTIGFTPLMAAALAKQTGIVELLVKHQALLNAQTNSGLTALMYAILASNFDTAISLLKQGADVNIEDIAGNNAILLASPRHDAERFLQMLLEEGKADPNVIGPRGVSPLYLAAYFGCPENVRLLLAHGANLAHETKDGMLSEVAKKRGYELTAAILHNAELSWAVDALYPMQQHPWAVIDGIEVWLNEPSHPHKITGEIKLNHTIEPSDTQFSYYSDGTFVSKEEELYKVLKLKLRESAAMQTFAVVIQDATTTQKTFYKKEGGGISGFMGALAANAMIGALAGAAGSPTLGPVIMPGNSHLLFDKQQHQINATIRFMKFDGDLLATSTSANATTLQVKVSPEEATRWNYLRFSNDIPTLERFLQDFSDGPIAKLVEVRLANAKRLLAKAKEPPVLFVYNIEQSFGKSAFLIDGKPIVKLGSFQYAKIRLQPGLRRFQLDSIEKPAMELSVREGDHIFLPIRGGSTPNKGIRPLSYPTQALELLQAGSLNYTKDENILAPEIILR
jgi:hypothetical protein